MKPKNAEAVAQVEKMAASLFATGFFAGEDLREEMKSEVPVRLMYALRSAGIDRWQLDALVLALRDVGEVAALNPLAPLDPQQASLIDGITVEDDLPIAFKGLLTAARPLLVKQRDLVALYALINSLITKWDGMAQLLHMNPDGDGDSEAPAPH